MVSWLCVGGDGDGQVVGGRLAGLEEYDRKDGEREGSKVEGDCSV